MERNRNVKGYSFSQLQAGLTAKTWAYNKNILGTNERYRGKGLIQDIGNFHPKIVSRFNFFPKLLCQQNWFLFCFLLFLPCLKS